MKNVFELLLAIDHIKSINSTEALLIKFKIIELLDEIEKEVIKARELDKGFYKGINTFDLLLMQKIKEIKGE